MTSLSIPMCQIAHRSLLHNQEIFWSKMITALAITQLMIGGSCVSFYIAAFYVSTTLLQPLHYINEGIIIGGIIIIAGVIGIAASKKDNNCTMVSFLMLSILAGVISVFPMVFGIMGASNVLGDSINLMMPISQLVLATVEIIVAIWSIGVSSQALCCPNSIFAQSANLMMGEGLTQFVANGDGQQVVIINAGRRRPHITIPYSNAQTPLLVQHGLMGLPLLHPGASMPYQHLQLTANATIPVYTMQPEQLSVDIPGLRAIGKPSSIVGPLKEDSSTCSTKTVTDASVSSSEPTEETQLMNDESQDGASGNPCGPGEPSVVEQGEAVFDMVDEKAHLLGV